MTRPTRPPTSAGGSIASSGAPEMSDTDDFGIEALSDLEYLSESSVDAWSMNRPDSAQSDVDQVIEDTTVGQDIEMSSSAHTFQMPSIATLGDDALLLGGAEMWLGTKRSLVPGAQVCSISVPDRLMFKSVSAAAANGPPIAYYLFGASQRVASEIMRLLQQATPDIANVNSFVWAFDGKLMRLDNPDSTDTSPVPGSKPVFLYFYDTHGSSPHESRLQFPHLPTSPVIPISWHLLDPRSEPGASFDVPWGTPLVRASMKDGTVLRSPIPVTLLSKVDLSTAETPTLWGYWVSEIVDSFEWWALKPYLLYLVMLLLISRFGMYIVSDPASSPSIIPDSTMTAAANYPTLTDPAGNVYLFQFGAATAGGLEPKGTHVGVGQDHRTDAPSSARQELSAYEVFQENILLIQRVGLQTYNYLEDRGRLMLEYLSKLQEELLKSGTRASDVLAKNTRVFVAESGRFVSGKWTALEQHTRGTRKNWKDNIIRNSESICRRYLDFCRVTKRAAGDLSGKAKISACAAFKHGANAMHESKLRLSSLYRRLQKADTQSLYSILKRKDSGPHCKDCFNFWKKRKGASPRSCKFVFQAKASRGGKKS